MSKLPLIWRLHPGYRVGMAVLAGQLGIAAGFTAGAIVPHSRFLLAYRIHAVAMPTLLVAGLIYLLYRIRKDRREGP